MARHRQVYVLRTARPSYEHAGGLVLDTFEELCKALRMTFDDGYTDVFVYAEELSLEDPALGVEGS